jgi:hypothetical protein
MYIKEENLKKCDRCGALVSYLVPTVVYENGYQRIRHLCYNCHIEVVHGEKYNA